MALLRSCFSDLSWARCLQQALTDRACVIEVSTDVGAHQQFIWGLLHYLCLLKGIDDGACGVDLYMYNAWLCFALVFLIFHGHVVSLQVLSARACVIEVCTDFCCINMNRLLFVSFCPLSCSVATFCMLYEFCVL